MESSKELQEQVRHLLEERNALMDKISGRETERRNVEVNLFSIAF